MTISTSVAKILLKNIRLLEILEKASVDYMLFHIAEYLCLMISIMNSSDYADERLLFNSILLLLFQRLYGVDQSS